jgi:RNA polymerase sigma factor for flagellar operon FliA
MDERALWAAYAKGDPDARQRLVTAHIGLVHFVVRQIAARLTADIEFDELVSAGTLGLMEAVEHFDPRRGLAFSTFAAPRIRGAVLDELRRQDHVPRSIRRKSREIHAATEELGRALAHPASDKEVATKLGIDLETLWQWQTDVEGAVQVSLDHGAPTNDETSLTPGDVLAAPDSDDIEARMTLDQEVGILRQALLDLSKQERTVLALYYFEELKLGEIAVILDLTESRVSQIRSKALGNLRAKLSPIRSRVA